MNERIVYLFYHGLGHINAFLKAAKTLEENNYDIYFAGSPFFGNHISRQSLRFYPLKSIPFGLGLEEWTNNGKGFFSALRDRITDRLFTEREVDLYWMIQGLKPSVILIDAIQATDFIVLYPHLRGRNIKVGMINTMLSTHVSSSQPPLNSDSLPENSRSVEAAIRNLQWQKFKKNWRQKFTNFGFDNAYLIKRRIKKNGVPAIYISKTQNLLDFAVTSIDELILAPREFDFPSSKPASHQKHVGFLLNEVRNELVSNEYKRFAAEILTDRQENKAQLVFCSFGTIPPKTSALEIRLLNMLISISREENFIVVISSKSAGNNLTNIPGNVYIFDSVPQLDVLKHSDLFISHGGLNSIKEAVYAEVPMLLYPLHNELDPKGNAARVAYHGLGRTGDAAGEMTEAMRIKIKTLLSDSTYKKKVQEMKNVDGTYPTDRLLDGIKALRPVATDQTFPA